MFPNQYVDKVKQDYFFLYSFLKIVLFVRYVEKHVIDRYEKHNNITHNMRFVCCLYRATDTHTEYVEYIASSIQIYLSNRATT
jgi:hypothetical protein